MITGTCRKLAVLVLAGGAVLAAQPVGASVAAKDSDKDAAVKAAKHLYAVLSDGQYERAYAYLHPAQKAIVSRECFVNTNVAENRGVSIEFKDVKKVYRTTIDIPGTGESAKAIGITAEFEGTKGDRSVKVTTTVHMIKVRGHWKFILTKTNVDKCVGS